MLDRGSPSVIFADDPTGNLDSTSAEQLWTLLASLAEQQQVTVIMVTHDRDQAARLADDVVFLHQGQLAEAAPAEQFFHDARSPETRAYLSGELLI